MQTSNASRGRVPGSAAEQEVGSDDKLQGSMGSNAPCESRVVLETINEIIQSHGDHKKCLIQSYALLQPAQGIYRVGAQVEDSDVYEFIVDVQRKKVMYKFIMNKSSAPPVSVRPL